MPRPSRSFIERLRVVLVPSCQIRDEAWRRATGREGGFQRLRVEDDFFDGEGDGDEEEEGEDMVKELALLLMMVLSVALFLVLSPPRLK